MVIKEKCWIIFCQILYALKCACVLHKNTDIHTIYAIETFEQIEFRRILFFLFISFVSAATYE